MIDNDDTVVADEQAGQNDRHLRFLAACRFWVLGILEQAAVGFRRLMASDRSDPFFARYWLASCLLQAESSDELAELLRERDDGSGVWRFAQALDAFRRHGDTEAAREALTEAHRLEPGFERFLLQDAMVDASREVRFDAGPAERSFGCARLFLPAWRGVPGAAAWARRVLKVPPSNAHDEVPRRFPRDELRSLPLRRETWQVGLRRWQDEPHDGEEPQWSLAVVSVSRQEVRVMTVIDRRLTETFVWNELVQAFCRPLDGKPARPARLVVCRRDFCDAWRPLLAQIGVRCQYKSDPQPVGDLLEAMDQVVEAHQLPAADDIDIRQFPQSDAVWQADFIRSPMWVANDDVGAIRPWTVLVLDRSRSAALATEHTPGDPTPEMLLELLVRTMARPGGQSAQRPRLIEVSDSDCYDHLRPRLEAAGIVCRLIDELSDLNEFCLCLARSCEGSEKCSLADGRGVTRALMESFYEAAADFFKRAPWRRVPGEVPIEVRCDNPALGTRYAVVLGRTGVQLGLCVCDDWEMIQSLLCGFATAEENRALALCYDEAQVMSAVDLQMIERLGWPIAAPEAWPAVMRLQPGRTPRSPDAAELLFLTACLRAIPELLEAKTESGTWRIEVAARPVELRLRWNIDLA